MAIHRFVSHNGYIREAGEAMLSPGQLGLLAGWGVFSTLRIEEGVLFQWGRHWDRMSHDALLMNVPMPSDKEDLRLALIELIETNRAHHGTLRLVVVRNGGGIWEGPPTGRPSDWIALTSNRSQWGATVRLTYQPHGRFAQSDFTSAKILSWSQNLCWYERAHQAGFDECILLNEHGQAAECTSANVFAVQGSRVWTPPLSSGCLPGVSRDIMLHEIQVPGIEIGEKTLSPSELSAADEVFITSTTRDLAPVAEIDGTRFSTTGDVRLRLKEAFLRHLASYVASNRSLYSVPSVR